jgi:cytochrome P450
MTEPQSSEGPALLELHGAAFQSDPHAALRVCAQRHWYANTMMGPAILGFDEVQAVIQSRQFRTPGVDFLAMQGITTGPLVALMQGLLLNTDGAAHDRVRRLVSKAFTGPRVEAYRATIRETAQTLAAGLGEGTHDFVAEFADPLGLRVLGGFVGIPIEAVARVAGWSSDIGLVFGMSVPEHAPRIEAALTALNVYIDELLAARRADPADDLLSGLIAAEEAGDLLTDAELRSMIITLMSAGHHTTVRQLGNAMATFMANPDQWQLLRADPSLAAQAAEEVVRHSPAAVLGVPRIAKSEVVLREQTFAPGTCVFPITGAANRDPRMFSEPDRFDITQRRRPHLTYGGGIHHCLGIALARAELQESLLALSAHLRAPQAAGPATWYPPTEAVYGPITLPIRDGA